MIRHLWPPWLKPIEAHALIHAAPEHKGPRLENVEAAREGPAFLLETQNGTLTENNAVYGALGGREGRGRGRRVARVARRAGDRG